MAKISKREKENKSKVEAQKVYLSRPWRTR